VHREFSHVTVLLSPEVNVQLPSRGQMAVHAPMQLPTHVRGPGQERLQLAVQASLPSQMVGGTSVVVGLSDAVAS
jgi:hypothetical protein